LEEDLDMLAERRIPPGTTLKACGPERAWPCVAGRSEFTVPEHDFDDFTQGPAAGPQLWAAFLPVGYQEDAKNTYDGWAKQWAYFFKKAMAFYEGTATYGRGLYLVSNDLSCLARSRPVWEAVGAWEIEFYAINEKGPGAFKNNPAGYVRANLENYATLDDFLAHAGKLAWMDEGWQSAEIFLAHMQQSRRRFVWWNVHSNQAPVLEWLPPNGSSAPDPPAGSGLARIVLRLRIPTARRGTGQPDDRVLSRFKVRQFPADRGHVHHDQPRRHLHPLGDDRIELHMTIVQHGDLALKNGTS
jgi:hypothetical protein